MLKDYLRSLKERGGYSWADIEKLSGIPEVTVRKVINGETENPRIDTVISIITALGGSLDGIVDDNKKEEIEMNALLMLKESYEKRISDIKEHIVPLNRDKKILFIAVGILLAFILGILLFDISIRTHGWIQY